MLPGRECFWEPNRETDSLAAAAVAPGECQAVAGTGPRGPKQNGSRRLHFGAACGSREPAAGWSEGTEGASAGCVRPGPREGGGREARRGPQTRETGDASDSRAGSLLPPSPASTRQAGGPGVTAQLAAEREERVGAATRAPPLPAPVSGRAWAGSLGAQSAQGGGGGEGEDRGENSGDSPRGALRR
ncbi:hypothetical protein NN561_010335 [Cricetulus griseus]